MSLSKNSTIDDATNHFGIAFIGCPSPSIQRARMDAAEGQGSGNTQADARKAAVNWRRERLTQ
ncbi:MAG: hypothetical protein ACLPV2_05330 [Steroidobacteraceae bacterium]